MAHFQRSQQTSCYRVLTITFCSLEDVEKDELLPIMSARADSRRRKLDLCEAMFFEKRGLIIDFEAKSAS